MALPAGVIAALGELAMSPKVQTFATRLMRDVYGKIMPSAKPDEESGSPEARLPTLADIARQLDETPTRDELITAFAVLQAELEREHRKTQKWLRLVFAGQIAVLLCIGGLLFGS